MLRKSNSIVSVRNIQSASLPAESGTQFDASPLCIIYWLALRDLGNNQLSGTIPSEMADMSSLRFLCVPDPSVFRQ